MQANNTDGKTLGRSRHLPYLDGLRGLAALYVVLHHGYREVFGSPTTYAPPPSLVRYAAHLLSYGHFAVGIFIVLSGYCLMLPVARSSGSLRGGFRQYLFRRSRRILPPYYAALVLSLLLIALVPGMNQISGIRWDIALPALTPGAIISHIFLLHNVTNWIYAITPPMWSVATEWQIYFLFPVLLLPVWRRFGSMATIGVAFSFGLAPHFLLPQSDTACPWFLGLFALGMVAAVINVSSPISFKQMIEWSTVLGVATTTVFLVIAFKHQHWLWEHLYIMDMLLGVVVACLLVYCTSYCYIREESSHPFVLKFMASRYCVLLGVFSYSLYLVHVPVLSLLHLWIIPLGLSSTIALVFFLSIGTLSSLAVSYLFHLLFERRFMQSPLKIASPENSAL
jgi:peptidoglycan/LPS O-acetylase OafA/YrhL